MKFIATVEESQKANILEIVENLKKAGIKIEQVLKMTGVITGSSNKLSLKDIKIAGIKSVEADRKVTAFR